MRWTRTRRWVAGPDRVKVRLGTVHEFGLMRSLVSPTVEITAWSQGTLWGEVKIGALRDCCWARYVGASGRIEIEDRRGAPGRTGWEGEAPRRFGVCHVIGEGMYGTIEIGNTVVAGEYEPMLSMEYYGGVVGGTIHVDGDVWTFVAGTLSGHVEVTDRLGVASMLQVEGGVLQAKGIGNWLWAERHRIAGGVHVSGDIEGGSIISTQAKGNGVVWVRGFNH